MLRKKLFGLFGKKDSEEETVHEEIKETPVISNEQISSLENLSDEHDAAESPEDIISKLAQINSIIGQEEPEDKDEMEDLFNEEPEPNEVVAGEEVADEYEESTPALESLNVAASIVLQCFPEEMLIDTVDSLIAKNNDNSNFAFYFDRADLLYGLSIGKLEFTIGDLVNKLPMNVFRDQIVTIHNAKIELPIGEILPLVPVEWFNTRDQDCSRERMVEEMEDLFPTAPPPMEEIPATRESESVAEEELEDQPVSPTIAESVISDSSGPGLPQADHQVESTPSPEYAPQPKEEELGAPPTPDPVPQGVTGVSKLQRSATLHNEKDLEKPVVPNLEDVNFTPLKVSEEEKTHEIRPADEEKFVTSVSRSDEERTVEVHRSDAGIPPERPSVATPEKLKKSEPKPVVDANELREIAQEVFTTGDHASIAGLVKGPPAETDAISSIHGGIEIDWKSQAPNGIDINRAGVEELVLLSGVGEHLARIIIEHRKKNGSFLQLQDLLKVPGLGKHTFRSMTRLSPKGGLRSAELRVNKLFEIDSETVSLGKIAMASLELLKLDAMFFSSIDGLVLTKSVRNEEYVKLADSLSAVAPQLYRRSKKALQQGQLPPSEMISFYFNKRSVTFSGSDQLFAAYIHSTTYPHQKQLKQCEKLTSELVWYCSYRAVLS